jgi:hypothetical protein
VTSWRTRNRGRTLGKFLASSGGMVIVDVSDHYPIGDVSPEDKRVTFILNTPLGVIRVVTPLRLYTQRLWLLGKVGRVAIEGRPTGAITDALVMMSAATYAALTTAVMDGKPEVLAEWRARHEGN